MNRLLLLATGGTIAGCADDSTTLNDYTAGVLGGDALLAAAAPVDSGAGETVVPPEEVRCIPVTPSPGSMGGARYECANGAIIANLGEKRFTAWHFDGERDMKGIMRPMVAQVTKVNKDRRVMLDQLE